MMMTSGGFEAILARLIAPQLSLHCDDALRLELSQTLLRLQDARTAMQRLRDVGHAAQTLGSGDATAISPSLLVEMEQTQRLLGRAVAAFGTARASVAPTVVCCTCGGVEIAPEEPLLTKPDTAALSPPRRPRPAPRKQMKREVGKKPTSRRKLVIKRRNPVADEEEEHQTKAEPSRSSSPSEPKQETPPPKTEETVKEEESDDVVIVEDDDESEADDGDVDIRTRLQRRIDECWPLATQLGALEMPQRRRADYANLVRRVVALIRVLLACDVEDMASRSMRSVLVKARDALAVAVSLLSLHGVTPANASTILTLVKAVDAASEKHPTLQKQVAQFRNVLADFEVALLTRSYATTPVASKSTKRKKPCGKRKQ